MEGSLEIDNTKDELIIILNENDEIIGETTRKEMVTILKLKAILQRTNNLIHRCTSIFIIREE